MSYELVLYHFTWLEWKFEIIMDKFISEICFQQEPVIDIG